MRQKYAVVVLLALIMAAGTTSFWSYRATDQLVNEDMRQALRLALAKQQSDVISTDTIRVFNQHLRMERLRGHAVLAVNTRQQRFSCEPRCSAATVFMMSEQRPATVLWALTLLWAAYCVYRRRERLVPAVPVDGGFRYGGMSYSEQDGRFYDSRGEAVRLTPMQRQLMEMFFRSSSHLLTKTEICEALWPKKEDASETLYTLVRRLRPVLEKHSELRIEADRGRAYELKIRT